MRILFIHPAYPNQFTALSHELCRVEGVETAFLTDMAQADRIRQDRVPIAYFGYEADGRADGACWYLKGYEEALRQGRGVVDTLPAVLNEFPADLVIGHASFGTTFYIRDMIGLPVISYVELPGYQMAWSRREYPALDEHRVLNTAFQSLVFSGALMSDAVVVPSAHARKGFPDALKDRVHVCMEGFSLPPLYPDKPALRRALGLPESGPILGFAGRTLEAVRGFDVFAEVAARLKALRPDLHILVIGSEETVYGNEPAYLNGTSFKRHALDRAGLGDGDIVCKDYLTHDDYHRHLQAMDLFYFPQFEGAANWGLFEAMASGLTVIASDRCFVPEVIDQGVNGWMVDPEDRDTLVGLSLYLLDHPAEAARLGRAARKTIRTRYSVEQSAAAYLDLIDRVIGRRAP
ncbi:glycosyltransferase [Desulfatiferula olefinivorans]